MPLFVNIIINIIYGVQLFNFNREITNQSNYYDNDDYTKNYNENEKPKSNNQTQEYKAESRKPRQTRKKSSNKE
jgi:hypothetical protein